MRLRWTALAAWLVGLGASLVLAWLFGLPELAALATAVAAALVISALWLARSRPPTVSLRVNPSTCGQGDPANLVVTFAAPAAHGCAPARLWGRLGTAGEGIVAVAQLGAGERTTVQVALPTPARGLVRIGPVALRLESPLGLWHRDVGLESATTMLVRPAVHQIDGTLSVGGRRPAPGRRLGNGAAVVESDSELVGLRPYVRGDDVRRIHWRTSARLGEPHVVQVEPPVRSPGTTVVLDQGSDSTPEGFERAVSAAASVLVAACGAGRSARLVTRGHDGAVADSGTTPADALGDLLDTLATVTRLADTGGPPATGLGTEEDTVVLVTATTSANVQVPPGVDVVVTCDPSVQPTLGGAATQVAWHGDASLARAWQVATTAVGETA